MKRFQTVLIVVVALITSNSLSHASRHNQELRHLDSLVLLVQAYDATSTRQYDRALALYTRVIKSAALSPEHLSNAHRGRGDVYFEKGDFDSAIGDYERALTIDPHNAAAYTNRGNIRFHRGSFSLALEDLNSAIILNPRDAVAFQNRGNVYFYSGQYGKAATDYRHSLALDPADLFSAIWLYLATARSGDDGRSQLRQHSIDKNLLHWPGPVVSLFLDNISSDELVSIATGFTDREQSQLIAEAYFYGAEYHLLHRHVTEAIEMFERVVREGAPPLVELTVTNAELERVKR